MHSNFFFSSLTLLSLLLGACDNGNGGADAGAGGEAPVITRVEWMTTCPAAPIPPTDYNVVITATDADTAAAMLTFTGSATFCDGSINAASGTINCPNEGEYAGTVTVRDPQGNSDTVTFTIVPCTNGSVTP